MKYLLTLAFSVLFFSCNQNEKSDSKENIKVSKLSESPIQIIHSPNPTNQFTSELFKDKPYKNMWFYTTTVKNVSEREIKIIWFESYIKEGDGWYASNVLQKPLTKEVFLEWYGKSDGTKRTKTWLQPGEEAVCTVNWHWSETKAAADFKWCYIAVDRHGNDYYNESIIRSVTQENKENGNIHEAR